MNGAEYQAAFNNVISDLQNGEMGNILINTANTAKAMIIDRIQEFGVNAQGRYYKDYTKQYKRFKMGLVKHRPETKNKNNYNKYQGYTDFTFTGRMWQNTAVVTSANEANADIGKATISQRGEENKQKMKQNTERFGLIMELSDVEIEQLRDDYKESIYDIWRRNGIAL